MKPIFLILLLALLALGCAGTVPSTDAQYEPGVLRDITIRATAPNSAWALQIAHVIEFDNMLWVTGSLKPTGPKSEAGNPIVLEDSVAVHSRNRFPLQKVPVEYYLFTPLSKEEFVALGNPPRIYVPWGSFLKPNGGGRLLYYTTP